MKLRLSEIRRAADALRLSVLPVLILTVAGTAQEPLPLVVSAGGGFDFPVGDAAETHNRAFNIGVKLTFPLTPRVAVEGALGYWRLGRDDAVILARRGEDPEVFRLGGGFFDGGHRSVLGGLLRGRLELVPAASAVTPYAFVGGGIAHASIVDISTYFLGVTEIEAGESEVAFAAEAGAGADVRLSRGVSLFAQAGYLTVATSDAPTTMFPLQFGLAVDLGGS